MSNLSLVDYTDTSSDEEEGDNKITGNVITSGKKIAVVQPTLLGHVLQSNVNQTPEGTSTNNLPSPVNSPVRALGEQNEMDVSDMDDVAHILLEFSEGRRGENAQYPGNVSPVIEISSSPLSYPEDGDQNHGNNSNFEIIDISSDSDTIPYEAASSPVSQNSTEFDLYNEFDVIITDRSCTTGENQF